MSEPNDIPISDRELHELFKKRLLEQDADDDLNQKLIDMETLTAFSAEALIAPNLQKEKELLQRLGKSTGMSPGTKWFFTGLSVAVITLSVVMYRWSPAAAPKSQAAQPVMQKKNTLITSEAMPGEKPVFSAAKHAAESVLVQENPLNEPPVAEQALMPLEDTNLVTKGTAPLAPLETFASGSAAPSATPSRKTQFYTPSSPGLPYQHAPVIAYTFAAHNDSDSSKLVVDTLLQSAKRLEVNGAFCNITLKKHTKDNITLKGELKCIVKGLKAYKPEYRIRYERRDTLLIITVENTQKNEVSFTGYTNQGGHLDLEVPAKIALTIKNESGDISASDISGSNCTLQASYGNIRAENMHTTLSLKSSSGNVSFRNVEGPVNCRASYGNVEADEISGNLKLSSASGDIKLNNLKGNAEIHSTYRNTTIRHMKGDLLLKSASGSCTADDVEGKQAEVHSNYGDINLSNITASLSIRSTSGPTLLKSIRGNIYLRSTYGDQRLSDITGDLNLSSSTGNVTLEKLRGAMKVQSNYGDVNLNDCQGMVEIRTQTGTIKGKNMEAEKSLTLSANYGDIRMNLKNKLEELNFNLQSDGGRLHLNKEGIKMELENERLQYGNGKIQVKASTATGDQYFD